MEDSCGELGCGVGDIAAEAEGLGLLSEDEDSFFKLSVLVLVAVLVVIVIGSSLLSPCSGVFVLVSADGVTLLLLLVLLLFTLLDLNFLLEFSETVEPL